jgi:hypothetical protein
MALSHRKTIIQLRVLKVFLLSGEKGLLNDELMRYNLLEQSTIY